MGNSLWNKLNNKNKNKKSNYEISKKTNIPEDKVKEIMNGERAIPTDRVDDFVGAIQENNSLERSVNVETAKRWIMETDLKSLRKKFNYSSQSDLAKELGLDTSTICRLENKKFSHTSDSTLIKYYDFFQDELNIKIDRGEKSKTRRVKPHKKDQQVLNSIDKEIAINWYKEFDLKEYLREKGMSYKDFGLLLGYSARSTSLISNLVNRKVEETPTGSTVILKAYAYINGLMEPQETDVEEETNENEELVEEDTNVAQEPNNEVIEEDLEDTPRRGLSIDQIASITPTPIRPIRASKPEFVAKPITTVTSVSEPLIRNYYEVDEEKVSISVSEYKRLKDMEKELEKYKNQVVRYEKLIDMIGR